MSTAPTVSGACLCGGVRFEASGPFRPVTYCHCTQCRKTSGHFVAATACRSENLTLTVDRHLKWFRSSPNAERGFCANCGSSLFYRPDHGERVSIMAGALDGPTGLEAVDHIFVADAGDYYSIDDGLPQHDDYGSVDMSIPEG
ncbi:MAG: GFA family protein [Woeseia sp.]